MSKFVIIASFGSLPEAYMARNILQGAGILCMLDNEHVVAMRHTFSALMEIRLRVKESDAPEAMALLAREGILPPPQGPVAPSDLLCPHCNGGGTSGPPSARSSEPCWPCWPPVLSVTWYTAARTVAIHGSNESG